MICASRSEPLDCVRISVRPLLNTTKWKRFDIFRSTMLRAQISVAGDERVLIDGGPSDPLGCDLCLPSSQEPDRSGFVCRVPKFVNAKLWGPQNFSTRNFGDPAGETNNVFSSALLRPDVLFPHKTQSTKKNLPIFPKTGQRDGSQQCEMSLYITRWVKVEKVIGNLNTIIEKVV